MFFRAATAASLAYLFLAVARLVHVDAPAPPPPVVIAAPSAPSTTRVVDVRRADLEATAADPRAARIVPAIRDGAPSGFKLYAIRPDSPLSLIGLQNGDTLRAINDTPLTSPEAALEVYRPLPDHLDLDVERRGELLRILVLLH